MPQLLASGLDAVSGSAVELFARDGVLTNVEHLIVRPPDQSYLAPGFIDIQVNGFAGVDYATPTAPHDEIARSVRELWRTGVTRVFPTIITGPADSMAAALRNLTLAKAAFPLEGSSMEGFHMEGPYISAEDGPRGAHPRQDVRPPDTAEFDRWYDLSEGHLRLITISPEWPGAPAYIEHAIRRGVVISIGHTGANAQQIADAVSAGATMSTHLGNGAHATIRRHPNYIWDQLADDRLAASFIVDGIHLNTAFLKVALRAKGIERSILTTDAVMPAGCKPGRYRLGTVDVELHEDDRVTLVGQDRLAGSSVKMHDEISWLLRTTGLSLRDAITMATRNPARAGRVRARQRGLEPGERADVVEFMHDPVSQRLHVLRVWVDGQLVVDAEAGTAEPVSLNETSVVS